MNKKLYVSFLVVIFFLTRTLKALSLLNWCVFFLSE